MPRSYRHIQQYEREMLELKAKGLTLKEIGKKYGLTREQTHAFFKRYNLKQRKIAEGESIKQKGRPNKNLNELPPSIQKLDKLTQMR